MEASMRKLRLFSLSALIVLGFVLIASAQPTIQGVQEGTLGPGTYIVVGNITVSHNTTLTIQPGTTFLHAGHYKWAISGTLTAIGAADNLIIFKRQYENETCKWGGIKFISSSASGSVLNHCVIEYCTNSVSPDYYGGGLYASSSSPTILNTRISNCYASYGGGVYAHGNSAILLDGCTVMNNTSGNGGGVYLFSCNGAQIKNSIVAKNISTST